MSAGRVANALVLQQDLAKDAEGAIGSDSTIRIGAPPLPKQPPIVQLHLTHANGEAKLIEIKDDKYPSSP
jgi:hypothetical protein